MTVGGALDAFDRFRPNDFTDSEKLSWLSAVETRIAVELCGLGRDFTLDRDAPFDVPLIVPAGYDEVYIMYMNAMADLTLGETEDYAVSDALFQKAYLAYADYVNRGRVQAPPRVRYY